MRFLLEFRPLFISLSNHDSVIALLRKGLVISPPLHVLDAEEIFSHLNDRTINIEIEFSIPRSGTIAEKNIKYSVNINRNLSANLVIQVNNNTLPRDNHITVQDGQIIKHRGQFFVDLIELYKFSNSMISSLFIGPFRNTINIGTKQDYLDIKIGNSFIDQFDSWKTGPSKRSNTEISSLIEKIREIFQFKSLDISTSADNDSLHVTIDGKPFKQHELGSGLSHFVIVLANAAMQSPDWILIDEPELNLHPSLQLKFLTAVGSYAKEGVWFSTHSMGLARSAAERVFSVSKLSDGNSQVRPLAATLRIPEFLGEMSFSSYKEMGFEKILLVEGPTDVKAVQHFLRLIGKDRSTLLLPLHGHLPGADELEEILRITTNVAALIDSEKVSSSAPLERTRAEFIDLCSNRGLAAHVLERRAIENYFPDEVVKNVIGSAYRGLQPFEKLSEADPHWSKSQNWKLAAAMDFDAIGSTDLGKFLNEL